MQRKTWKQYLHIQVPWCSCALKSSWNRQNFPFPSSLPDRVTISASWWLTPKETMLIWWFHLSPFYVQITSLNGNSDVVVDNIPDELATEIPRTLLLGLSSQDNVLQKVNKKRWKRQQVSGAQSNTHFVQTHRSVNSGHSGELWYFIAGWAFLRADCRRQCNYNTGGHWKVSFKDTGGDTDGEQVIGKKISYADYLLYLKSHWSQYEVHTHKSFFVFFCASQICLRQKSKCWNFVRI